MWHISAFAKTTGLALTAVALLAACGDKASDGVAYTREASPESSAAESTDSDSPTEEPTTTTRRPAANPVPRVPGMPAPMIDADGKVDQCKLMLDILSKGSAGLNPKAFVENMITALPQTLPNETQDQRDLIAAEWRKAANGSCD